jgi:hypothetical protein
MQEMIAAWLNIIAVFSAGFAFGLWMPKGDKEPYRSILRRLDGYDTTLDDCDSRLAGRGEVHCSTAFDQATGE